MPCGCQNACGCTVIGDGVTTTAVTVGDTTTISAIQTVTGVTDTACVDMTLLAGNLSADLVISPDDTAIDLACSPNGLKATIEIDAAGTAPVTQSAAGLKVDCCAETVDAIADTNSVDLILTGSTLSADVRIDPAGSAPVTVGAAGVKIDCCTAAGLPIADTTTVDLSNGGGTLSAVVIPNTLAGLENQAGGVSIKLQNDPAAVTAPCTNRLRFVTGTGDLTALQDGADITGLPAGSAVGLAGTIGNAGGNSSTIVLGNNDTCPVFVLFQGLGVIVAPSTGAAPLNRVISQRMDLVPTVLAGGAIDLGSSAFAANSDYNFQSSGVGVTPTAIPAALAWRFQAQLHKWVYLPVGAAVTMVARTQCLETQVGWESTLANGASFTFTNYTYTVFPERIGGWLIS